MHVIEWRSIESADWCDYIPENWFDEEGEWPSKWHTVVSPSKSRMKAHCSLNVIREIADLCYGEEHTQHNEKLGLDIGTLRFTFIDGSRSSIQAIQWRDVDEADFEDADYEFGKLDIPRVRRLSNDPTDGQDARKRIEQTLACRQGQAAFRDALMDAYEQCCAVTGCKIDEILEAAHIIPYRGEHTNDVTNGLLLRADIHNLFDLGLIKIDRHYLVTARADISKAYGLPKAIRKPKDRTYYPDWRALDLKCKEQEFLTI